MSFRPGHNIVEAAAAGIGGQRPPSVSTEDGRFTLIDAIGNEIPLVHMDPEDKAFILDVVIMDANPHVSRVYYKDAYKKQAEYKPPTCFSDNGKAPSMHSVEPQSATCQQCPHAEWGSAVNANTGGNRKACNDYKKIAVMPVNMGAGDGVVFLLRIPPASLKGFSAYAQLIGAQVNQRENRKAQPYDVVTRVKLADKLLSFKPVTWVSGNPQLTSALDEAYGPQGEHMAKIGSIIGLDDVPYTGQIGRAAPQQQLAAAHQGQTGPATQFTLPASPNLGPPADYVPPGNDAAPPRRRRSKAEMEQEAATQQGQQVMPPQANVTPLQPKPTTDPFAQGGFGMAAPQQAPQAIMEDLSRAFGLPKQ